MDHHKWQARFVGMCVIAAALTLLAAVMAVHAKWYADEASDLRIILDTRDKCAPAPVRKSAQVPREVTI